MKKHITVTMLCLLLNAVTPSPSHAVNAIERMETFLKNWRQSRSVASARLTVIEKKNNSGAYAYKFMIHNDTSKQRIGKSDAFYQIANWGLITGNKKILKELPCMGEYYYNKKNILKCRPVDKFAVQGGPIVNTQKGEVKFNVENVGLEFISEKDMDQPKDQAQKIKMISNFTLPDSIKSNVIFLHKGNNPEDGFVVGYKWGFTVPKPRLIRPGESLGGFKFTLNWPLDRKKVRFWAYMDVEFPNDHIQFIDE